MDGRKNICFVKMINKCTTFNPFNLVFYGFILIGCAVQTALVVRNYFRYEMVVAVLLDHGPAISLPSVTLSSEFLPFINHTKFVSKFPPSKPGPAHYKDEPINEHNPDFNVLSIQSKEMYQNESKMSKNDSIKTNFENKYPSTFSNNFNSNYSWNNFQTEKKSVSSAQNHLDYATFAEEIQARIEKIENSTIRLSSLMDLLIDPKLLFQNCFVFDIHGQLWKKCLDLTQPVVTVEQRRTNIHMHRTVYYTLFANKINLSDPQTEPIQFSKVARFNSCSEHLDQFDSDNETSTDATKEQAFARSQGPVRDNYTSIYMSNNLMHLPARSSYVAYVSNRGSGRIVSMKISLPFLDQIDHAFGIRFVLHHPQIPPNSRTAMKIGLVYRKHGWYALKYTHNSARLLPAPFASNCRNYREIGLVNKRHCVDRCIKKLSVRECNSIAFFTCMTRAEMDRGPFAQTAHCATRQKCFFKAQILERCEEKCPQEDCEWHVYDANIALQTTQEQPYLLVELMKPLSALNQIYEYRAAIKPLDVFIYIGGTVGMWFGVSLLSCYQKALRFLNSKRPTTSKLFKSKMITHRLRPVAPQTKSNQWCNARNLIDYRSVQNQSNPFAARTVNNILIDPPTYLPPV